MQKQVYETPDVTVFGNIEALTAGQSEFSPRCFTGGCGEGSRTTYPKPTGDKHFKKWNWGWSWWGWH